MKNVSPLTVATTLQVNSGTSLNIDWTVAHSQAILLNGNCVLTFTAPEGPAQVTLKVTRDTVTTRTLTWPAAVKWAAGSNGNPTATANAVDIFTLFYSEETGLYYAIGIKNFT